MKIIRIKSGLGNQMFQYALYRSLLEISPDVKLDRTLIDSKKDHNGYELDKIFFISENICTENEVNQFSDDSRDIISRFRRKIFGTKKTHYKEKSPLFDEKVFKLNNVLIDGYWQNERYFKNIEEIIREEFKFKLPLNEKNKKILDIIQNTVSVSIHVRRGDYLLPQYRRKFYGICDLEYYNNAINFINEKIKNCTFFIFSDDMEWVKENIKLDNAYYIDWNKGNNSYCDMQLMSNCQHNIIANSSFSWWGAWLNNNPDKIVIAPKRWFNDGNDYSQLVPKLWNKI